MPVQALKFLKNRAAALAYNSPLYGWSLRGPVPDRLVMRPVDPWPGDVEAGRWLCNGAFSFHGQQMMIGQDPWAAEEEIWRAHMHGFVWLRDLRALASEKGCKQAAQRQARVMIYDWAMRHQSWEPLAWRADLIGQRLVMWICAYEFYGEDGFATRDDAEVFQEIVLASLMRQARHLSRVMMRGGCGEDLGVGAFMAAKGLLYAGLAFEGCEGWIAQALEHLMQHIDRQIAGDGGHRSRSPQQLLEALQILLDVRMALQAGGHPLPEKIQHAIDRMGPALRFFRYSDRLLAQFNGTQEGQADLIESVLSQAAPRGKMLQSLPCTGYERAGLGRTTLLLDCGRSPPPAYQHFAHAGPLAFEMCYGRERLFVNCGTHEAHEEWRDALRATPAHNTVTLDHRNACEIKHEGTFARKVSRAGCVREDTKNAVLLEAHHDGYVPLNGFTHRRRLYLSQQGHDLRGEEFLSGISVPQAPIHTAIRFHLHPRVLVSLIRDGQEALLRLPGGIGWRFHHGGGCHLALEDSIYVTEGGHIRKTKQLALYTQLRDKKHWIKWALQKEG